MKVLANETKRILAVLLSVAMIFAYVPNNVMAYADENTDENAVVEEGVTNEAANTVAEEPASEPDDNTGGGDGDITDDPEDSQADVDIWLVKDAIATSHIVLFPSTIASYYRDSDKYPDPTAGDDRYNAGSVPIVTKNAADKTTEDGTLKGGLVGTKDYKTTTANTVGTDSVYDSIVVPADHDNDFVFYMKPAAGYAWKAQGVNFL